jgi:hypothetical protein
MASQKLTFALQSPVGLRFGSTRVVEAEKISFEMDMVVPTGIECEFQLELPDDGEMVTGLIRIERARPKRANVLPRYLARILELGDGDRERLDAWRTAAENPARLEISGNG